MNRTKWITTYHRWGCYRPAVKNNIFYTANKAIRRTMTQLDIYFALVYEGSEWIIEKKKRAYTQCAQGNWRNYITERNMIKLKIRITKAQYWGSLLKRFEKCLCGGQKKIKGLLRNTNEQNCFKWVQIVFQKSISWKSI